MEHTIASAVVQSQKNWKRKPADFYPTPWDATEALLRYLDLPKGTRVLEPACGDGDISRVLEADGMEVESCDLRHTGYGRGGVDFLDPEKSFDADWIITNPPFRLSVPFIKRSLSITPNVALLLKAAYWNTKGRKQLFRDTKPALVLALTWRPAFLAAERGNSPLMDVIWVVWKEGWTGLPDFDLLDRPAGVNPAPRDPARELELYLRCLGVI